MMQDMQPLSMAETRKVLGRLNDTEKKKKLEAFIRKEHFQFLPILFFQS